MNNNINNNTESKCRPIYSMKLAGLAMLNGFTLISIDENFDGSGKNVFFFKDTPRLARFIDTHRAAFKSVK